MCRKNHDRSAALPTIGGSLGGITTRSLSNRASKLPASLFFDRPGYPQVYSFDGRFVGLGRLALNGGGFRRLSFRTARRYYKPYAK